MLLLLLLLLKRIQHNKHITSNSKTIAILPLIRASFLVLVIFPLSLPFVRLKCNHFQEWILFLSSNTQKTSALPNRRRRCIPVILLPPVDMSVPHHVIPSSPLSPSPLLKRSLLHWARNLANVPSRIWPCSAPFPKAWAIKSASGRPLPQLHSTCCRYSYKLRQLNWRRRLIPAQTCVYNVVRINDDINRIFAGVTHFAEWLPDGSIWGRGDFIWISLSWRVTEREREIADGMRNLLMTSRLVSVYQEIGRWWNMDEGIFIMSVI